MAGRPHEYITPSQRICVTIPQHLLELVEADSDATVSRTIVLALAAHYGIEVLTERQKTKATR